jgi:DUF971 family protein
LFPSAGVDRELAVELARELAVELAVELARELAVELVVDLAWELALDSELLRLLATCCSCRCNSADRSLAMPRTVLRQELRTVGDKAILLQFSDLARLLSISARPS